MKKAILIFLLILGTNLHAQDYDKKFHEADSLVYAKTDTIANARKGYQLYSDLYDEVSGKMTFWYLYDTALAANKISDVEAGFYWLNKVVKEKYKEQDLSWILKDAKKDFYNLTKSSQWESFQQKVKDKISAYQNELKTQQQNWAQEGLGGANFDSIQNGKQLYQAIQDFNDYPKIPSEVFGFIKLNDTLDDTFFARIPAEYDPKKPAKVLFFLNGAVRYQQIPAYPNTDSEDDWQRFYKQYAEENNVVMVYPNCNKDFNWMLGNQGFGIVPKILQQLKQFVNVDDNQVFVAGHSNGATGAFNYAVKNPNAFGGFYGMNTQPKVFTGGTFLKNLSNRSFYNISTDRDYYFSPTANDSLVELTKNLQIDFSDHRYNGFPHWFPAFPESEKPIKHIFENLEKQQRNPFPSKIYWECDDTNSGKIDWLAITKLDTLQPKKEWQKQVNFGIHQWKGYDKNDSLVTKDTLAYAFDFPRKSGAIKASYKDNVFRLKTSRVSELSVFISSEMVDMDKPVSIYVNGKKVYNQNPKFDRDFILKNIGKYYDRKAIWVEEIRLCVSKN